LEPSQWGSLPLSQLGAHYAFHTGDLGLPLLLGFAG